MLHTVSYDRGTLNMTRYTQCTIDKDISLWIQVHIRSLKLSKDRLSILLNDRLLADLGKAGTALQTPFQKIQQKKSAKKISLFLNMRTMRFDQSSPASPILRKRIWKKSQKIAFFF